MGGTTQTQDAGDVVRSSLTLTERAPSWTKERKNVSIAISKNERQFGSEQEAYIDYSFKMHISVDQR